MRSFTFLNMCIINIFKLFEALHELHFTNFNILSFSFNLKYFLLWFLHWHELFSFQIFMDFPDTTLLLICSLIPFCYKNIFDVLNLLRTMLQPRKQSIFINIPFTLEKIQSSCCFMMGWPINASSVKLFTLLFKSSISLLIFCLLAPLVNKRGWNT